MSGEIYFQNSFVLSFDSYIFVEQTNKMKTLTKSSQEILEYLTKACFGPDALICKDIAHVEFVIKSDYGFGQLSTKLEYITYKDMMFAVHDGNLLNEIMFEKVNHKDYGFKLYRITDEAFKDLEMYIRSLLPLNSQIKK